MIVLDTHVWIWCVSEPKRLSRRARELIEHEQRIGISSISCWEVAMLATKGRISFDRPVELWIEQALALPGFECCNLTPAVAVLSAQLADFHGDAADRMIAATAAVHNATLVTKDAKIRRAKACLTAWT